MSKCKSHNKIARKHILRAEAASMRRRVRRQARQYDRTRYDKPEGEGDPLGVGR